MKTWKACTQVNGVDYTSFTIYDFEVEDELFDRAMESVQDNEQLSETDVYDDLVEKAEKAFDLESAHPKYSEEEPSADDYDDEDEYSDACEEYESDKEDFNDEFYIENTIIEDPGDFERFKKKYIGIQIDTEFDGENEEWLEEELEYEYGDGFEVTCIVSYLVNSDGEILDIKKPYAEACVGEDVKETTTNEILPDYEEVMTQLDELWGCEDLLECEFCGKFFRGDLTDLGEMTAICDECLEDNYSRCSRCGAWNDSMYVHMLANGKAVCDDCLTEDDEVDE